MTELTNRKNGSFIDGAAYASLRCSVESMKKARGQDELFQRTRFELLRVANAAPGFFRMPEVPIGEKAGFEVKGWYL